MPSCPPNSLSRLLRSLQCCCQWPRFQVYNQLKGRIFGQYPSNRRVKLVRKFAVRKDQKATQMKNAKSRRNCSVPLSFSQAATVSCQFHCNAMTKTLLKAQKMRLGKKEVMSARRSK